MSRFHPAVVRIAVRNNFNCTPAEWAQVDEYAAKYSPVKKFFVNSNINTPKILTINDHPYKAVITANPNLTVKPAKVIATLSKLDPAKVGFVRVKWVPEIPEIPEVIDGILGLPLTVVITMQRFNKTETLLTYANRDDYTYSCTRFRMSGPALADMLAFVDARKDCYVCDRSGQGCLGCGQCSTLTIGESLPIRSLNLSSSGECPYNCPDCYAKAMYKFLDACKQPRVTYDKIYPNRKQTGQTKHIQDAIMEAA